MFEIEWKHPPPRTPYLKNPARIEPVLGEDIAIDLIIFGIGVSFDDFATADTRLVDARFPVSIVGFIPVQLARIFVTHLFHP
jgi:hypothetical protein